MTYQAKDNPLLILATFVVALLVIGVMFIV